MSPTVASYAQAGVDIDAGNEAVARIAPHLARTARSEQVALRGGFAAGFALDLARFREPLLVSSTDGVGTKVKVASLLQRFDTVGIDLVAMCVNDIVTSGAEPLWFLDYVATGALRPASVEAVVAGVAEGCVQAGCALAGGETAEMPGMYASGDVDLAGFAVGVVERAHVVDGSCVRPGDAIVGIASSGLHSNGYSLARHLLVEPLLAAHDGDAQRVAADLCAHHAALGRSLADELLEPTRIYARAVAALAQSVEVRALAHVTGGGLRENVPRTLPGGVGAVLERGSWREPAIFSLLATRGELSDDELLRVFNMGLGMTAVVAQQHVERALEVLEAAGETAWVVGEIVSGEGVQVRGSAT